MGNNNTFLERNNGDSFPEKCTYCDKEMNKCIEFFPHEAGGYCIFAPRNEIDYACPDCAYKKCEDCGTEQIRYGFINCDKCNKVHCFNNTDMIYENNPALEHLKLCRSRFCKSNDLDHPEKNESSDSDN